ncbi:MAG: hypothetical protein KDE56_27125 [Anaerolineales bacterium]|nr:hypothetical protein [Anaerolineales bacterium]
MFEITIPTGTPLTGSISAKIVDKEGVPPGNIIRADDDWAVKFHWTFKGQLASCICGEWCLHVHMESIGKGPELDLFEDHDVRVPLNPCGDGEYWYTFEVPAGTVPAKGCGPVYKAVATLTYRTPCDKPGPIAGFVDLGLVQFYRDEKND